MSSNKLHDMKTPRKVNIVKTALPAALATTIALSIGVAPLATAGGGSYSIEINGQKFNGTNVQCVPATPTHPRTYISAGSGVNTNPATASISADGNGQVKIGIGVMSGGQNTSYQQVGDATLTKTANGYHSTGQAAPMVLVPETFDPAYGGHDVPAHNVPGPTEPFQIDVTCP